MTAASAAQMEAELRKTATQLAVYPGVSSMLSARRNAEARYAHAYEQMVRAGLRPKLKKKYSGGAV